MEPRSKSSPPPLPPAPPRDEAAAGDELEFGWISGVFGFRGEVRLHLHHRESAWLTRPRGVVLVDGEGRRYAARLKAREGAGRRWIGRVEGVDTEAQARAMEGWRVLVPRAALPEPAADEFYVADVVDRPAFLEGRAIGRVTALHDTGPVAVLELEIDGRPAWVPLLRERIVRIGRDGVHLVPGALVLDEEEG